MQHINADGLENTVAAEENSGPEKPSQENSPGNLPEEEPGIAPYVDESIGTADEGKHEQEPIPPQDLSDPQEIEARARILASTALNLYPTERQQREMDHRYDLMVKFLIDVAKELNASDRLIHVLQNLDTISAARQILTERNRLAYALINLVKLTNSSITDTILDYDTKKIATIEPLTFDDISDTFLIMQYVESISLDILSMRTHYEEMKKRLDHLTKHGQAQNSKIIELTELVDKTKTERNSYGKAAAEMAQHPLRGFSDNTTWVLRHRDESDIYVGLTNTGKKRKEPIITDFISVKGLDHAYRVIGGERGCPELRDLMERLVAQKFFRRINYEDFQIEKITTQIYGS